MNLLHVTMIHYVEADQNNKIESLYRCERNVQGVHDVQENYQKRFIHNN